MAGKPVVAIQGERGSYSEEATRHLLGMKAELRCCERFEDVFQLTASQETQYCLIPIENSLSGSIHKNYDLLLRHHLRIAREINLQINHNLIVKVGTTFEEINTVFSHPVALDQCDTFFEQFPHLIKRSAYDTSGSVKRIVEENLRDCAAIAGKQAAEFYGGEVVMTDIQDDKENFTRFFLLSPEVEAGEKTNKTSVVFSFRNTPGALFKCISVFALRDIDLTKIESRPIRGRPWEYLFYLDFLGNIKEENTRKALDHLEELTEFLEVLGCYPRDVSQQRKGM
ncbi:MAG: prephenate dehydratase [Acidobacteria bacterium]|nr:prephenate dehydratase [Acidobacteriota bacterium]MCZ6768610.1 prephenate dehydratase [Acidobacteriota bacterium]MCZ6879180.1 prephenate dehydratase [Acidobacteriota bacterium]